ncbi:hypothetical protein PRNP1_007685 [Phytophthora ramorum]
MARQDFLSEFVLRELLAALGAPLPGPDASSATADSFSESLSEESESQAASNGRQSRVMLVRRTNSAQQRVTLVDRRVDVEAFVPKHVVEFLRQTRGYQTLGRLRGSVVRVVKYHFATLARCLATDGRNCEASVSLSAVNADRARVYLYVDALAIVEENDLAADPKPDVYNHSQVAERLQTLSAAELEKQLMIHQGLPPLRAAERDRFDDECPLLDEDCIIPEEQEQELEQQEEWGAPSTVDRQLTDSELIDENGSVPMLESQVVRGPASPDKVHSTQDSVTLSGNPSVGMSDEASINSSLDSQRYPFQQEDIQDTFVVGSDLENSDTEEEDDAVLGTQKSTPSTQTAQARSDRTNSPDHCSPAPTASQNSWMIVDLTDDSPEKAPPAHQQAKMQDQEPKIEAVESQEEKVGEAAVLATQDSPLENQEPSESRTPAKSWGTLFRKLASNLLGTPSAEDSNGNSQREFAESDEPVTQLFDQPEEEKEAKEGNDDKHAEPEEFMSSQATVVLEYTMDNDEDANAFEYEGMLSDDMVSPRSVAHEHDITARTPTAKEAATAGDRTLTEEGAEPFTPQKKSMPEEDNAEFKTPSPSAHAVTPGTEKRADVEHQKSVVSTANPVDSVRNHPPNSQEPILPSESPAESPSNLVISVGTVGNQARHTGLPSASRGSKRHHQQISSMRPSPAPASAQRGGISSESEPLTQTTTDDQPRAKTQKRRRREVLSSLDAVRSMQCADRLARMDVITPQKAIKRAQHSNHAVFGSDTRVSFRLSTWPA